MSTEYYYRYEDQSYSVGNEDGDHIYSILEVHLRKLKVIKHTRCGVRVIGCCYGGKGRFINSQHRKRYAFPTIEEAAQSYRKRKAKQISIYMNRIRSAEEALQKLTDGDIKEGRDW